MVQYTEHNKGVVGFARAANWRIVAGVRAPKPMKLARHLKIL